MAHARLRDGIVREILQPLAEGTSLDQLYPPAMLASIRPCGPEVDIGWIWNGEAFSPPEADVPSLKKLTDYAARKRWKVETGGIVVGGIAVNTDRASQSMITGAFVFSQQNPSTVVKFKARAGFVDLDAATVGVIAAAVGAHVQAAFAVESNVVAAIDAGTITTTAEINAADWPVNGGDS